MVGMTPLAIQVPESMPMSRRMTSAVAMSPTACPNASSMAAQLTWKNAMAMSTLSDEAASRAT